MKLGPGPTLSEALDEARRVGLLVGGAEAKQLGCQVREIGEALPEGKSHGPRGCAWPSEAKRLKLACNVALIGHRNRAGVAAAEELAGRLEELAGKALAPDDQRTLLALARELAAAVSAEAESHRLAGKSAGDPLGTLDDALEGKSFFFPAEQDRDVERLLRRIGGYRVAGAEPGPGGYDEIHFCRAMALIDGAEPKSDAEREALAQWRERWG